MKYLEFTNSLRSGKLAPVYFFSGEEAGLIDEGVQVLLDKLLTPDMRDFNYDLLYANEVTAKRVLDIARSYPMMTAYRVVLVREVHKMSPNDLNGLAEYVKKPSPSTYLILTQRDKSSTKKGLEAIRKAGVYVECRPLYDNQIAPWIQDYVKRLGKQIAPEAAQFLATEVGGSIHALKSELEKIQIYLGTATSITLEHAQHVAGTRREFSVFSLQDAFGEKNLAGALRIVEELAVNTNITAVVSSLARYFNHLYLAKALSRRQDLAALAEKAGVHAFFAERLQKAASGYDVEALLNAFEVLHHVDYLAKSQGLSQMLLLRLTVVAIVKKIAPRYLPIPRESSDELFAAGGV
ncbi:MAG: DNA polymerase III subunit delta [candidate division KSB1 bacterium]